MVYDPERGCVRGRDEMADEELPDGRLSFDALRQGNMKRIPLFGHTWNEFPGDDWSGPEWGNALAGEAGEACNVLKKMHRGLPEDPSGEEAKQALAHELADVVCYADLVAARFGIDLGEAVREKFNIVSDRRGTDIKL